MREAGAILAALAGFLFLGWVIRQARRHVPSVPSPRLTDEEVEQ